MHGDARRTVAHDLFSRRRNECDVLELGIDRRKAREHVDEDPRRAGDAGSHGHSVDTDQRPPGHRADSLRQARGL
jgi:hypothetical protein